MSSKSRRLFLQQGGATAALVLTGLPEILRAQQAPTALVPDSVRPQVNWGLQIGDVTPNRAIVWSRADKAARLLVEWSRNEYFQDATVVRGPFALECNDYTARVDLTRLPADEEIFVRLFFTGLDNDEVRSEPLLGRFRTAPDGAVNQHRSRYRRDGIRFVWSGDTAGQGYGIDLDFGGMRIYEAMRQTDPDFFIHSGDTIYADGPMSSDPFITPDGATWRNAHLDEVPEKLKVAETQREFHRAHLYNRYDEHVRRFSAEVPQIWQWDDHEVINNWSSSKDISSDVRYSEKHVPNLVAHATRAFLDYAPLRAHDGRESERVYRKLSYGTDLDVFVIDMRSYRGPNTDNLQASAGPDTTFLGAQQLAWLKRGLAASNALWKVIAADMPLGLRVADGALWEAVANGDDGVARGRELEIAHLLQFIRREHVDNVVWLTADVHYCAAHYYDPNLAQMQDFEPFWEFVAGPLNAGSFGPNALDATFGPQVVFAQAPAAGGPVNLSPYAGLQFFGQVDIDSHSKDLQVALKDLDGNEVFGQTLVAKQGRRQRHS